ncbi:MAG: hypothetical protein H7844_09700 [Nitrospirae bacterium YQR-1]
MRDDAIAITGAGVTCSLGRSTDELYSALVSGKCGIGKTVGYVAEGMEMIPSAQAPCLDASSLGISQKNVRIMDTHSYLLMESAIAAFKAAGFGIDTFYADKIAFYAGIGMVDYEIADLLQAVLKSHNHEFSYDTFFTNGYREIFPLWPLSMLNNIAFCQSSIRLGLKGDNTVFSPHGESAVYAISEGASSLLGGKSTAVIAGGISEKVNPQSLIRARYFDILTKDNELRPFSQNRAGTVLGEAGAFITMELCSFAKERGMSPVSSIAGWGFAFDCNKGRAFPTTEAISHSMEAAINHCGIYPDDIDVLIAYADGTASDTNEIEAINAVFSRCGKLLVTATTGAIGNTLAAAPVVNIIVADSMIKHGLIPPSVSSTPVDNKAEFNIVVDTPVKAKINNVLINSLSYEGHASSVVVQRLQ